MATLYRTNGFQEEVLPMNGKSFTLAELQTLVGGYIQMVYTHDDQVMMLDEEGKLKGKAINHVATTHFCEPHQDVIVGDAVIGTPREMGCNDDDDEAV